MGCSSGRLRGHGAYDPSGTVLAYLLAGALPALTPRHPWLQHSSIWHMAPNFRAPPEGSPSGYMADVAARRVRSGPAMQPGADRVAVPAAQAARRRWPTCGTSPTWTSTALHAACWTSGWARRVRACHAHHIHACSMPLMHSPIA